LYKGVGYTNFELYYCPANIDGGILQEEGRVGAALWDLFDGVPDETDNGGDPGLGVRNSAIYGLLGDTNSASSLDALEVLIHPLMLILPADIPNMNIITYLDHVLAARRIVNDVTIFRQSRKLLCYNYYLDPARC
jgi:hypothetical protein